MLHVGHSRREGGWPLEQFEDWQGTATALIAVVVAGGKNTFFSCRAKRVLPEARGGAGPPAPNVLSLRLLLQVVTAASPSEESDPCFSRSQPLF